MGLPVPPIFVATNEDFELEVVDGLQRISTLLMFLAERPEFLSTINRTKPLRLQGLETLDQLNGLTYSDCLLRCNATTSDVNHCRSFRSLIRATALLGLIFLSGSMRARLHSQLKRSARQSTGEASTTFSRNSATTRLSRRSLSSRRSISMTELRPSRF
ncbi:MAG: DUF262 domain-containing protein [Micrococcales bacterium]|nr:DUF262 domain-containing protein [Micrococcales bacterium]